MWIRLRFDISRRDLLRGMTTCGAVADRQALLDEAERIWGDAATSVVCLSVRSGFDLLLSALQLPAHSEVLMSALTVPDMPRIVRHHGLHPVPVDLVPDGCTVSLESLKKAITARSRVLVVAHLFGVRRNMEPILQVARRHGLFVIEDCAQAYEGPGYRGHEQADASLFSFGPIKTATALGGGVMRVRSAELAERTRQIQQSYDVQSRWSYFRRLAKYALLQALAGRVPLELIARGCQVAGVDLDKLVAGAARNFPAANLIEQLRRQPSVPLLRMLIHRWRHFDADRFARRVDCGGQLTSLLGAHLRLRDEQVEQNSYWVFPVLVPNPLSMVVTMRSLGLDATSRSRLSIVTPPPDRPELFPLQTLRLVERTIFLPCYPEVPPRLVRRAADVLAVVPRPAECGWLVDPEAPLTVGPAPSLPASAMCATPGVPVREMNVER